MGFLPNGDLIIVSKDYKIYSYSLPVANSTFWECSQIYDLEITESLKSKYIDCFVYQTKLFLFYSQSIMVQWNLSTMNFEMQYFFDNKISEEPKIVINKNQTLLALNIKEVIYVFSMETGMQISRYSGIIL